MIPPYHYSQNFRLKRKTGKKGLFFSLLIIFSIIFFTTFYTYKHYIYSPVEIGNSENVSFVVKKGETIKQIAGNLYEKNLIKSPTAFYLFVKYNNIGEKFISGRYLLNKGMNVPDLTETLTNPSQSEFVLTVPEGFTITDIDKRLTENGVINESEFINATKSFNDWQKYPFLIESINTGLKYPLEGYLFPDTYFVDPDNFSPQDLISLSLNNFQKKLSSVEEELGKNTTRTLSDIIIMASIIEKEVINMEDKQLVSGILWKRLDNNWTLGADATLLYDSKTKKLTSKELNEDNPYNTRKKGGLPPGPICNPGLSSIKAASNPKDSNYWFYLSAKDGKTIFSVTNDEHNINKQKYLY